MFPRKRRSATWRTLFISKAHNGLPDVPVHVSAETPERYGARILSQSYNRKLWMTDS